MPAHRLGETHHDRKHREPPGRIARPDRPGCAGPRLGLRTGAGAGGAGRIGGRPRPAARTADPGRAARAGRIDQSGRRLPGPQSRECGTAGHRRPLRRAGGSARPCHGRSARTGRRRRPHRGRGRRSDHPRPRLCRRGQCRRRGGGWNRRQPARLLQQPDHRRRERLHPRADLPQHRRSPDPLRARDGDRPLSHRAWQRPAGVHRPRCHPAGRRRQPRDRDRRGGLSPDARGDPPGGPDHRRRRRGAGGTGDLHHRQPHRRSAPPGLGSPPCGALSRGRAHDRPHPLGCHAPDPCAARAAGRPLRRPRSGDAARLRDPLSGRLRGAAPPARLPGL
ncbi:hypothetical protein ruthe_02090 [Rubellimicrobium thermophilum DSM 16684]|uniref:Uncharacterized protein n=1 Tax=Rubellimicrobium thermophilum DSM 16684 TaxID=1123069 RepID=S9S2Y9_9RHOB|nr:hypothetical protein ruthe_02090 [Rubellimicrobium thermophilum DSM 16684]